MTIPNVFIASSTEGLPIVEAIQRSLRQALNGKAAVSSWPGLFELTATYIESIEKLLSTSDFAVLVLTPDDVVVSRDVQTRAPRDNVLFEIGAFFGRLGRRRCFLIQLQSLELKLPTDLLGIETAKLSQLTAEGLDDAVAPACARVARAIIQTLVDEPRLPRLSSEEQAIRNEKLRFAAALEGEWWERVTVKRARAGARKGDQIDVVFDGLGVCTIASEPVHDSVKLEGQVYDADGAHLATWRSAAARVENSQIRYVRECKRLDVKSTAWLPGYAEVTFHRSDGEISEGDGKFSELDESRPKATELKLVDLRRSRDADVRTMRSGTVADRKLLVQAVRRDVYGESN